MAMRDLLNLFKSGTYRGGKARTATKRGPGRMPPSRQTDGAPRLQARTIGGNWQGQPYLSYAEHDKCVRESTTWNGNAWRSYDQVADEIRAARV